MTSEEWRFVPGTENEYQVSDLGQVRSFKSRRLPEGRILAPGIGPVGQRTVSMYLHGGKTGSSVARLVALAFLGEPEDPEMEAQHIDAITDDSVGNIVWGYKKGRPRA